MSMHNFKRFGMHASQTQKRESVWFITLDLLLTYLLLVLQIKYF